MPLPNYYWKQNALLPGGLLQDIIAGYNTEAKVGTYTVVPGKITNAIRWGNGETYRNAHALDPFDYSSKSFTARVWVRLLVASVTDRAHIADLGRAEFAIGWGAPVQNKPGWEWNFDTVNGCWAAALADTNWHHVVFAWDHSTHTMKTRVDNGADTTAVYALPNTGNQLGFGGTTFGPNEHETCEFGIWESLWTPAEYAYDYNGGTGRTYP